MNALLKIFDERRRALQAMPWLRPVLLMADLILLVAGIAINPILGLVFGLLLLTINEVFSPVVVRRVFVKEMGGELKTTGTLTTERIRREPKAEGDSSDDPADGK